MKKCEKIRTYFGMTVKISTFFLIILEIYCFDLESCQISSNEESLANPKEIYEIKDDRCIKQTPR